MKVVYRGFSDQRMICGDDFPDLAEFDEEVIWTPGSIQEVPDEVGRVLVNGHHTEFKEYQPPDASPDLEVQEQDSPQPTREEREVDLMAKSRTELVDLVETKELMVINTKTTKPEMVKALLDHYDASHDQSVDPE